MVASFRRYRCEKCRKIFHSYRDAESCELGHIVTDCLDDFRKELAQIVGDMTAPETKP